MTSPNPPILTFDYAGFIAQIPAYSDPTNYPESLLQQYWNGAINYVSDIGNFGAIQGTARQYALNLMTAHLIFISNLAQAGQVPGMITDATIDKVHVGLTPPPLPNQWQWWLDLSPYGQQLLAQLQTQSTGGFFIAGPYGGIRGYNQSYGYGFGSFL
jgi:hypothetical protein